MNEKSSAIARTYLELIKAVALARYTAPWLKNKRIIFRDEAGRFASSTSPPKVKRPSEALNKTKVARSFSFPSTEEFARAKLNPIAGKSGTSDEFATCEINGKKFFLKNRDDLGEEFAEKEEICTLIANELDMSDLIIPAKKVEIGNKTYTASPFQEEDMLLFEQEEYLDRLMSKEDLKRIGLFDFAIANLDRNEANLFIQKSGVKFFDHELAFGSPTIFRGVTAKELKHIAQEVTKEDLEKIVAKKDKILKIIAENTSDPVYMDIYQDIVRTRFDKLESIAKSEKISREIRSL